MGVPTGTTITYGVGSGGGNREDLEDTIWEIFADETWALTNLEKVSADATFHEHQLDTLVAPGTNIQLEGDDASFTSIVSPTRVGNYCQIFRKDFAVSRTQERIAKAGRKTEAARQMIKQMREIKNDMEYAIVRNQASSVGGAGTGRSLASMESWIATNSIESTTTASATTVGYSSGTVAAPTDGTTTSSLTEGMLRTALQGAWSAGGQTTTILTSATQKANIDAITGVATRMVDISKTQQASIIGAANLYVSSFGTHKVILHRHVRSSVLLCLDPDYWATAWLDRPFSEQLAKTGDSRKYQIIGEMTLVSRNEKASAKVAALA